MRTDPNRQMFERVVVLLRPLLEELARSPSLLLGRRQTGRLPLCTLIAVSPDPSRADGVTRGEGTLQEETSSSVALRRPRGTVVRRLAVGQRMMRSRIIDDGPSFPRRQALDQGVP
jgi:hypothetical protein